MGHNALGLRIAMYLTICITIHGSRCNAYHDTIRFTIPCVCDGQKSLNKSFKKIISGQA